MSKPLSRNEVKRVARVWLASFTAFYIPDYSEGMTGDLGEDELRAIFTEIEAIGDRLIGKDIHRSNLNEVVEDVLNDRKQP